MVSASSALEIVDWRRRVFSLYRRVREQSDAVAAHTIWIDGRNELFADHPASPLLSTDRKSFTGLPVPAYDERWRFELVIEPVGQSIRLEVPTGTDGVVPFELLGQVDVPDAGTLDVWRIESYGGGIFIPVKDLLAGRAVGTYGGGRYLIDTIKGADLGGGTEPDSLVIDFNFAYNPSCAYDPAWACPLAPRGNVLDIEIPVGELYVAAGP